MTEKDLRGLLDVLNNVSAWDLVHLVYTKASPAYIESKANACMTDPIRWMSSLDESNLGRLAELATDKAAQRVRR